MDTFGVCRVTEQWNIPLNSACNSLIPYPLPCLMCVLWTEKYRKVSMQAVSFLDPF